MIIKIFIKERIPIGSGPRSFWSMTDFEDREVMSESDADIRGAVEDLCIIRANGMLLPEGAEFKVQNASGAIICSGLLTAKKEVSETQQI